MVSASTRISAAMGMMISIIIPRTGVRAC